MDAYIAYIQRCKSPKNPTKIKHIVESILEGLRLGQTTEMLARSLNEKGVRTIQDKFWSYNALQMQLLKMAKSDPDSSLAWALSELIDEEKATLADVALIRARTRVYH
jgi:hypothetical protein